MKKVILFAVILGWMGLGCSQSQCNSARCVVIRQARTQKVESQSFSRGNRQSTTINYLSNQPDEPGWVQHPLSPSLIP